MNTIRPRIHHSYHYTHAETPFQFDWDDIRTAGPPSPKDQSLVLFLTVAIALFVGLICYS